MEPIINRARLEAEAKHWRELEVGYRRKPPEDVLPRLLQSNLLEYAPKFFKIFSKSLAPILKHNSSALRTSGEESIYFFARLLVIAFALTAFISAFGRYGTMPYVMSIPAFLGVIFAIRSLIVERGNWVQAGSIIVSGFVAPGAIQFLYFFVSWRPLSVVFSAAYMLFFAVLIDLMCVHAYLWIAGNPKIENEARKLRDKWIKERFSPTGIQKFIKATESELPITFDPTRTAALQGRIAELKALMAYRRTFFTILAMYIVIGHLPNAFLPSILVWIVPTFYAFFKIPGGIGNLKRHFLAFGRALQTWLAKRSEIEEVPGLFRTVYGSATGRRLAFGFILCAFCVFVMPALRFFPVAYEISQYTSLNGWAETFAEYMGKEGFPNQDDMLALLEKNPPQALSEFLNTRPYGWIWVAMWGATVGGKGWFLLAITFSMVACFFFPMVFMFTFGAVTAAPLLLAASASVEDTGAPEQRPDLTDWECYVQRLQASNVPLEREHLWIGTHAEDDYPILLHRDILSEHAYLVGDSGSGKTALGILPILAQLTRMNDAAVVIIDLKGDNALFQTAKAEARAAGRTFKWFTNEIGRSTYAFNPFQQKDAQDISLNQFCETILEALNLNHGEGYGRSYFSRIARRWLSSNIRKRPHVGSFEELYKMTADDRAAAPAQERQDTLELIAVIESLASFEQLNATIAGFKDRPEVARDAIFMPDVLNQKQVIYFWLPAAVETATVREFAKLALYSLLTSAYMNRRSGGEGKAFLVIDEFQRIASDNFKIVLEQARSMGIGAILANQTLADLKTHDADLRPTIQTNTRFKLCFSATDPEQQQRIMVTSGERTKWRFSFSNPSESSFLPGKISVTGMSMSETVVPRINRNDVIQISDDPRLAICHISRGSGYSQFSGYSFPVEMNFSLSKAEYDLRRRAPWPEPSAATIVPKREPLQPEERIVAVDTNAPLPPADTAKATAWLDRLKRGQGRLQDEP